MKNNYTQLNLAGLEAWQLRHCSYIDKMKGTIMTRKANKDCGAHKLKYFTCLDNYVGKTQLRSG